MRNFSNQSSGRPAPGGNRGGYNRSGSGNKDNREHRDNRDNRGGGYRDSRENRGGGESRGSGENRGGGGYRGANRSDRGEYRGERLDNRSGGGNYRPAPHPSAHPREHAERSEGYVPRTGGSWVEITGRNVEEAVEEACRRFNVGKGDLRAETLEEGSKGFLGIGSKPAKVKIALKPHAVVPFAEGVLSRLLRGMSLPDKVKSQRDSDGNAVLNIQGPSSGTLIGRHGHTLESLQYLVSKIVQRMTGDEKTLLVVDVENYLERQKDKLKELALNLAQKAKETGVEIPMRPMSSKDRRVVHLALKENEHVTTESRGEGLRRKVVIIPKVKAENPAPETVAAAEAAGNVSPSEETPGEMPGETPVEVPVETPVSVSADPGPAQPLEPGNVAPKEKPVDDNIGNH